MSPIFIIWALLPALINGQELNRLPDNLLMGFASASYQVEGAWNEEGKYSLRLKNVRKKLSVSPLKR